MIATVSNIEPAIAVDDDVLRLVEMRIVRSGLSRLPDGRQVVPSGWKTWIRWLYVSLMYSRPTASKASPVGTLNWSLP